MYLLVKSASWLDQKYKFPFYFSLPTLKTSKNLGSATENTSLKAITESMTRAQKGRACADSIENYK